MTSKIRERVANTPPWLTLIIALLGTNGVQAFTLARPAVQATASVTADRSALQFAVKQCYLDSQANREERAECHDDLRECYAGGHDE